ncbi:MAG: hypothetical protein ACNA7J_13470 [Wenzhouxiangella sp.]
MRAAWVPWIVVILAVVGAGLSLLISQSLGLVPQCNVFLEGCTSISGTGRQEPASFVYRATIIPAIVLLSVTWWLTAAWLGRLGAANRRWRMALVVFGGLSPVLAVIYVVILGASGVWIDAGRQWISASYFTMALVAKLFVGTILLRQARTGNPLVPNGLGLAMFAIPVALLLVMVTSVMLELVMADASVAHNLLQWPATMAFAGWYFLLGLSWKVTGLEVRLEAHPPAGFPGSSETGQVKR